MIALPFDWRAAPLQRLLRGRLMRRETQRCTVVAHGTAQQLLSEVWSPGHAEQGHYLRIYVHPLRQKLEAGPARPVRLQTDTGIGYGLPADTP